MSLFSEIFTDYTLRNIVFGSLILGLVSGVLGSFAILRRQGLMGDALSHAALPGICIAFIISGSKAPLILMLGAAVSGWIGMSAIHVITRRSKIDMGSALGLVLTTFFGLGVVLLTVIQKSIEANKAGLDKFMFGQAAALVSEQVTTMGVLGLVTIVIVLLCYKEFKVISFDPEFATTQGISVGITGSILTGLLIVAIVIGLNTVGVILMSAMLVGPAAAARQWTNSLSKMIFLSSGFGALSGIVGSVFSFVQEDAPTGPCIIIFLTIVVFTSLIFGSAKGSFWKRIRRRSFNLQSGEKVFE